MLLLSLIDDAAEAAVCRCHVDDFAADVYGYGLRYDAATPLRCCCCRFERYADAAAIFVVTRDDFRCYMPCHAAMRHAVIIYAMLLR